MIAWVVPKDSDINGSMVIHAEPSGDRLTYIARGATFGYARAVQTGLAFAVSAEAVVTAGMEANKWAGLALVLNADTPSIAIHADPDLENGLAIGKTTDTTTPAALLDDRRWQVNSNPNAQHCWAEVWVFVGDDLSDAEIAEAFQSNGAPIDYRTHSLYGTTLTHVWRMGNNCPDATDSAATIYDCVGSTDLTGENIETADLTTADYPAGP
jgi:hypothetical protein